MALFPKEKVRRKGLGGGKDLSILNVMFDSSSTECFDVPPNIWEILPKLEQTFQNHHQHNILPEMQRVKHFKMVKLKCTSME